MRFSSHVTFPGADPTDSCGFHYSPLQMAAEQGVMRALKAAFECLPVHRKTDQDVLDSILAVFQSSCYECVTGTGGSCQRCRGGDEVHPAGVTWTGVLDFLTKLSYRPSEEYLECLKEFRGKERLVAYYVSKLRGEEPRDPAEGRGVSRRPLSLIPSLDLSNSRSGEGHFGELSGGGQLSSKKPSKGSKPTIPKSALCGNCKGREKKMKVCGQCRRTSYCSRDCQRKDWKVHKKSCTPKQEWRESFTLGRVAWWTCHSGSFCCFRAFQEAWCSLLAASGFTPSSLTDPSRCWVCILMFRLLWYYYFTLCRKSLLFITAITLACVAPRLFTRIFTRRKSG